MVESPVRVAIRNRGSNAGQWKSNPKSKQVFYLRTKQKSRRRALGDLKRTWREGKTGLLAHLSEVSRITVALAGVSMSIPISFEKKKSEQAPQQNLQGLRVFFATPEPAACTGRLLVLNNALRVRRSAPY
ncbi:hypothetical protein [Microcoleus vaginatus]|uniref:hypothetical protein n=1 Tax=Microcoleus vaginatus TaxID=119532 RepID=UPI00168729B0|nr:hypothetical protein [Microcoleus sp. FACHB-84]